jgi:hypothetical protein
MFEGEHGYPMGPVVRSVVAYNLFDEGMRGPGGRTDQAGHTNADVADMIGVPTYPHTNSSGGKQSRVSPQISALRAQYEAGVPAKEATSNHEWRKRGKNRQVGAGPDDPVMFGGQVPKRVKDWYSHEAATAVTPMPTWELVRQVLIAHMDKVEAGRKASRRTSRSRGKAA